MMALDTSSEHAVAADADNLGVRRIGQIAIPIKDLDRAVAFYRDVLGLRFLFQAPPGLAFFECGGVRLMLSLPEGPDNAHHASVIYYQGEDRAAAWTAVTERGARPGSAGQPEPHLIAKMPDH